MISICMLKLCGNSLCQTLEIIFTLNGRFPLKSKKANAVPIHKKCDKQTTENYCPISLLLVCGKIFERLLYDTLFNSFLKIIYFLQVSLDSDQGILAWINFFQLTMKSYLTSPKLLTKYDMMGWYLSCVKMIFTVKWLIYFGGLPERQKAKNCFKWPVFILGWYSGWCTTRIHFETFVIFNVHQWFIK